MCDFDNSISLMESSIKPLVVHNTLLVKILVTIKFSNYILLNSYFNSVVSTFFHPNNDNIQM